MKMKRLLSTILAIAMVLVLCPSTQIIFAKGELIPTKISGTVTATTVAAGSPLGTSVITGTVITDDGTDTSVNGTFKWDRPTTWLTASGTYPFTFIPTDSNTYASCSGEAVVLLDFDKETAIQTPVLDQNFDNEEIFQVGVAGEGTNLTIDATGTNADGGTWKGVYAGAATGSHVISGTNIYTNPPVDKHNEFHNNRVLALKYETLNNNCPVLVSFPNGSMGQNIDFVVTFRIYRLADASMFVGLGNGQYDADKQHAAVVIAADGSVTVGDSTTSIGTLAKDVWATVELRSNKSGNAVGSYTVTVTPDNGDAFSGDGTTKDSSAAPAGYGSSNVNKMVIRATSGTADTAIAYMDDVYVERVTNNPVQVNESFDNTSIFTTDAVPIATITGSTGETWEFKTTTVNDATAGSCVADTTDGDYYTSYAYSGYQSLYLHRPSGNHGQISVGNYYAGSNTPYINTSNLTNADDFEYSFRLYWLGGALEVFLSRMNNNVGYSSTYLTVSADGTVSVFGSADDTTTYTASTKTLTQNAWSLITVTADRSEGEYVVKVDGEEFITGYLKDLGSDNSVGGLIFRAGYGAEVGYLDDVKFDKVVIEDGEVTERTAIINQSFEHTSYFDSLATYSYEANGNAEKKLIDTGAGGYWVMQFADGDYTTPLVINTHDGDGTIEAKEPVYSESQAMKVARIGGNALDGVFKRKLDYTTEDYRLSFVLRLIDDDLLITMGHNSNFDHADAAVQITAGYQIQTLKSKVLTNTNKTLEPCVWYSVTLETDRAEGTYKVTFEPQGNNLEKVEVVGDLTGTTTTSNADYVRFYAGYNVTAGTIDDVKLVALTPAETARPTYTVDLPQDFESDEIPTLDQDYTFRATNTYYNYTFTATTGGVEVTVTDNGDGTYTLGPVGGNVEVAIKTKTGKSFGVTVSGEGAGAAEGYAVNAVYGTSYALQLNPEEGYDYAVSVTIGGEAYELVDPVNNIYTIDGAAIIGTVEITVDRALKTYDVTFTGNGAEYAAGTTEKATHGVDYTFTMEATGADYTVIFNEVELTPVGGVYTIPGAQVTGALTITVGKVAPVRPEELVVTVPAGGALKDATIVTQVFVDAATGEITVPGTITWTNPALWMNENREVEYTFTPNDLENYKPYTGMVMVTMVGNMSATPVMGLQNFDDTGKFILGAAGSAVDGWTYADSAVVFGTNPPVDQHRVQPVNRVLALKQYTTNAGRVEADFFRGNVNGKNSTFDATFRVYRVANAPFWVGYGSQNSSALEAQNLYVSFDAEGNITVNGGDTIGTLPLNKWATVEIHKTEATATGAYTFSIVSDDGSVNKTATGNTQEMSLSDFAAMNFDASVGDNSGTTVAYFDDIYVYGYASENRVCLDQDFEDSAKFPTDTVPTAIVEDRIDSVNVRSEKWEFKTLVSNEVTYGACVTELIGEWVEYAYSGHQAVQVVTRKEHSATGAVFAGGLGSSMLPSGSAFEVSFQLYWTGKPMQVYLGRLISTSHDYNAALINIAADGTVTTYDTVGASTLNATATGKMIADQWVTITFTSAADSTAYTVTATQGSNTLFTATGARQEPYISSVIFDGVTQEDATVAYVDDVKIVKINGETRETVFEDNLEDISKYDATKTYERTAVNEAGGTVNNNVYDIFSAGNSTWKIGLGNASELACPFIINTHDGDGLVDMVYSNTQALKLSDGNAFQYALTEAFAATQNYTFSARVYLMRDKAMTITFADAEGVADAEITLNNTALMSNTWATVALKTDRATGKYTVTVTPDNGAEYEAQGNLAGKAVSQILFATESEGTVAYVDNVSLAKNDLIIADKPVYQVTLPEGMVQNTTAELGANLVISTDNSHYNYTDIAATMTGVGAVEVIDNGDGTYTIENVYGDIEVTAAKTPKTYNIAVNDSTDDVITAPNQATYGESYVLTVDRKPGYTYTVHARYAGGAVEIVDNEDGTYTIAGENIVGDITITVKKTINKYTVTWNDATNGDVAGKLIEVTHGQAYAFIVNKVAGYTYTVSAAIGETPVAVTGEGNRYTIAEGLLTGNVTITVTKELASYNVNWTKPGDLEVTGEATATHGAEYSFSFIKAEGYKYTVTATIGGNAVALIEDPAGTYTIAEGVVDGDLMITIVRQQTGTVTVTVTDAKVQAGLALSEATYTLNASVDGTFAWVRPTTWMNESKECAYIFTPDDETLAPVEGIVTVTIWSENMNEEVILDQDFDDEEIFQVGVENTDNAIAAGGDGGTWKGVYAGAAAGSHLVSGQKTPVDKHRVQPVNRVLALKQYTTNAGCVEADFFRGNINGKSSIFDATFRVYRVANAPFWVGYGSANNNSYEAQNMVVSFDAEGNITVNGGETIATLPLNKWATVNIRKAEEAETGAYTISIVSDDGSVNISSNGNAKTMSLSDFAAMNFDARGGDNSGTTVAYFDDIYVQRLTDNVVCLDQSFEDSTKFPTDTIPAAVVTDRVDGSNSEKWEFKTLVSNEVTYGACVTKLIGEWVEYAYSGHQAVELTTSSANAGAAVLLAGGFGSSGLPAGNGFEISFRLYWLGKPMQVYLGRLISTDYTYNAALINIAADGTVTTYDTVGASTLNATATGKMIANQWVTVTFTSAADSTSYTVTATQGDETLFTATGARQTQYIQSVIFDGTTTENAVIGYMDDIKVVNTSTSTTLLDENFEDVSAFDATVTYSYEDVSTSVSNSIYTMISNGNSTWRIGMRSGQVNTPFIINTHDGDTTGIELVMSEKQAMKVARLGGSALDADLRRAMDYATEDYRLTFMLRLVDDDLMITMGNNVVTYSDAAVQITTGYKIQTLQNGDLADTTGTLQPYIWYSVTLKTDRANSTYTVTFVPQCNGFETVTVDGDTNNAATAGNNQRVRFYAGYNVTAGYIDDVKLVALTAKVEPKATYTVDLEDGISGAETATLDSDYTFSIDEWDEHYTYTFDVTMGGNPVEVIDNGNGNYTIEGVCGDIVINNLVPTAKTYNIIFTGDGAPNAIGDATADYGTEYTFTLTKDENYDYVVTVDGVEQTPDEEGTYTITVTGDMEITVAKTEKVVTVNVEWGEMTFEYENTDWNSETHTWNGVWNPGDTNTITVTNSGGVAITVSYYFAVKDDAPADRVTGWQFAMDTKGENLVEDPVALEPGADPLQVYLILQGRPTETFTAEVLGTVTVGLD